MGEEESMPQEWHTEYPNLAHSLSPYPDGFVS